MLWFPLRLSKPFLAPLQSLSSGGDAAFTSCCLHVSVQGSLPPAFLGSTPGTPGVLVLPLVDGESLWVSHFFFDKRGFLIPWRTDTEPEISC